MSETQSHSIKPPTQQQIAALAYALWLDAGCPLGRDMDLWLEAERQLKGSASDQPAVSDDIPADPDRPLTDEDPALQGQVERALDEIATPRSARSPTSL